MRLELKAGRSVAWINVARFLCARPYFFILRIVHFNIHHCIKNKAA